MSIQVSLRHRTEYKFDRLTTIHPHIVRLRPAAHCRTPILAYNLSITPSEHFINWQQDSFGNYLARLVFPEKANELVVDVNLVADMTVINPFDFFLEPDAEHFPFSYDAQTRKELEPYFEIKDHGPLFTKWLTKIDRKKQRTIDFLVAVNQLAQEDIGYVIRMEEGVQSAEETLTKSKGSCRDSAWLVCQALRHCGLATRFVSGYLVQLKADTKSLDGPSGTEQDFTDLHAWTEVYIPGAGWVGLDPTSGLFAGEGHIPLACSPSPMGAAAITGSTSKCEVEFSFSNEVTRFKETPRTTKPYSDQQWQAILALGKAVDAELNNNDVRLTMGGEPTFISIDNMDGAEWNTKALGDEKYAKSLQLLKRLNQRFSPGGVIQHSQGKWYPGEELPRWAMHSFWRKDKATLWQNLDLLTEHNQQQNIHDASKLIEAITDNLGIDSQHIQTAYEDNLYYLWQEGTLPENVTPEDNRLKNSLDRKRLRKVFERGLDQAVGYTVPLAYGNDTWHSSQWQFRREQMYLLPGDSPIGLRLPMQSLPWVKDLDLPFAQDPFDKRVQLQLPRAWQTRLQEQLAKHSNSIAAQTDKPQHIQANVYTSLSVEPRDGKLHVFLPPVTQLEHYVELIEAIEVAAEKLALPIVIEGYEPPKDDRLQRFSITPDPGVIEVNIQPSRSWKDLVNNTETLYEEAKQSRLATEKFNLDGRHTGTGGGNHITLGGATPNHSPLLRRPHLLGSLLSYWQHHPSLSYLFSGQFIGPTSQAPRIDEARDDRLYELSIALQQLPLGDNDQPWLTDRILRNLLTDLTGNTHRSEFCIDKLYSPDSSTGRLGILEFRGFEMPPHPQMSLMQQLLLRSLVSRFWDKPYQHEPVHWGTQLHDKFMLPHYVENDIKDVVSDLNRWGYQFDPAWFAPFVEFRFPQYGEVNVGDIHLELRAAIEPWHVLGEEMSGQGTARYVDSSVERLQLKSSGLTPNRHQVLCNGRALPLKATARQDEKVSGVRFKAWAPPSALHPTIPEQQTLVFDVVDTWNHQSLGGCTYHVNHPGGRNYDSFPVNSYEAESRRRARFWQHGHTPGAIQTIREENHGDHPYTLDLRYQAKPSMR